MCKKATKHMICKKYYTPQKYVTRSSKMRHKPYLHLVLKCVLDDGVTSRQPFTCLSCVQLTISVRILLLPTRRSKVPAHRQVKNIKYITCLHYFFALQARTSVLLSIFIACRAVTETTPTSCTDDAFS